MSKIIAIVGSRRRHTTEDFVKLETAFDEIFEEDDEIVSGGCPRGADSMAQFIADDRGISICNYHAEWEKYGRAADPIRNKVIAEKGDVMIALPVKDRKGGTESAIKAALDLGKKVVIV